MVRKKPQHKKFGHQRHEHKSKYAKFSHAEKRLSETLARENSASEAGSSRKSYESLSLLSYHLYEHQNPFQRRSYRNLPYLLDL